MKQILKFLLVALVTSNSVYSQNKKEKQMEKRIINPWQWQDSRSYVQAVDVQNVKGTLYISGQAAVNHDGTSSNADMRTQLKLAIQNLEKVINESGYEAKNIVRLNVYCTSSDEFIKDCFDIFQDFVAKHGMTQAVTLLQVDALFETLNIELEATAVK